ncbi:MAG: hypothetical protein R3B70_01880 [Polyangiaceae bacterium]
MSPASRLVAAAALTCAAACGPSVPVPELATHDGDEPILVPYPPPVPRVELIPPRPAQPPKTVWIDGQWIWRARVWEWQPGRWEPLYPGATYAPPAIVYLLDRRIAWYAGKWHGAPPPPPSAPSSTPAP